VLAAPTGSETGAGPFVFVFVDEGLLPSFGSSLKSSCGGAERRVKERTQKFPLAELKMK
jgi:hypothetical protein